MEEALQSIARAFERNRASLDAWPAALAVLAVAAAALGLWLLTRRVLARSLRLRALAAHLGLGPPELRLARGLARRVGVTPDRLLTHLDVFEQATAQALSGRRPPAAVGEADPELDEAIRRLRHLAGFDRLPVHAPLLSSRELSPGTAVSVAGRHGQICEVGEVTFSVELAGSGQLEPGRTVALDLAHAREARYALRCPLLAARAVPEVGLHLVLGHDEAPQRIQQRAYARVPTDGPIVLRPAISRGPWPLSRAEVRARLVDASGGGVLVSARGPLPAGLLTRAAFAIGDMLFADVRAVVLSSEPVPGQGFRLHLEFPRLPEAERSRLVAAVERLEVAQEAARRASG